MSEISLSINTWQPDITDKYDRLVEATTRFVFGSIFTNVDENLREEILNPFEYAAETDELCNSVSDHINNLEYLANSLNECGIIEDIENSLKFKEKLKIIIRELVKPSKIKDILAKLN